MSDEKKINDGGQVFPTRGEALLLPAWVNEKHPEIVMAIEKLPISRPGITLREVAALVALHGLMGGLSMHDFIRDGKSVTGMAWSIADAFLSQQDLL